MNGPVHTLKPDEALSWDRFRALPRSLQQDYIKHILSKFKVGPAALGRMFGVSEAYCGDYLKKQLGITFQGRTTRQETIAARLQGLFPTGAAVSVTVDISAVEA